MTNNPIKYRTLSSAFSRARLLAASALVGGAFIAQAQTSGVWINAASGDVWSDTAAWQGGNVATGGGNADFSQVNVTVNPTVVHLDSAQTIGNLIFGDLNTNSVAGWLVDDNASAGANTLTLSGTTPTITVKPLGAGNEVVLGPVIAGTTGLTLNGGGILDLTNAETLTGGVAVNQSTLNLDFTAGTTTILPSQALTIGGGTLTVLGNATSASSQTFSGLTLENGNTVSSLLGGTAVINVPAAAGGIPTLNLGAITYFLDNPVVFNGPATSTGVTGSGTTGQAGANGNASTTGQVAATANITTTTGTTGGSLVSSTTSAGNAQAVYATVGLYDFAGEVAGSPNQIVGLSQATGGSAGDGGYFIANGSYTDGGMNDMVANTSASGSHVTIGGLRFNENAAITATSSTGSGLFVGGILVTPNVGAFNSTMGTGGTGDFWGTGYSRVTAAGENMVIWQNNTSGFLNFVAWIGYGSTLPGHVIQCGPGTVVYSGMSTTASIYIDPGSWFLNGGVAEISKNNGLGYSPNGYPVFLNGGTILATASLAMDNGGTPLRPVSILANGGGIAAVNGTTVTVDGIISNGVAGAGPLIIGIPASSANGNVLGQVPGTGTGTANATAVLATGNVIINGGGSGAVNNTYTGGTVLDSGILQWSYNNLNLLGTGGITLNGGTFQWNGVTTDISARPVTLGSAGGTLDLKANTVTFANSIGNNGSGALTVASTGGGGVLNLNGTSYTGLTTVGSGATLGIGGTIAGSVTVNTAGTLSGAGTISGNLTMQSSAPIVFTQGSPVTVSGSLVLNNNSVTVYVPGGTPLAIGSYTLMTYNTSGSSGAFNTASPTYTGAGVAGATVSSISTSGGIVTLTVASAGVAGTWNVDANGNWSTAANWSSNPNVPHAAGDGATFGTGSALRSVNLDMNETVGSITMNNNNSFAITNNVNTLTLDNTGHGAAITVTGGITNNLQTKVSLNDNATATVSSGKSLTISGTIVNASTAKTLAANGAGALVLSSANSYGPLTGSVGTTLSGGTLQVGNNSALGAGDLSSSASTLQAGAAGLALANNVVLGSGSTTLDNDGAASFTLNGIISGSGNLVAANSGAGTGKVVLGNAANTYAGPTTVKPGSVASISADGDLGTVPGSAAVNIQLNGGDLLGSSTLALNANRIIGIGPASGPTGGSGNLDAATSQTLTVNGILASDGNTGANNLIVNGVTSSPGTVTLVPANNFSGTVTLAGGTLQLGNALTLQNGVMAVNSGTLDFNTFTAVTFGALGGTGTVVLNNTAGTGAAVALTLGNNNTTASDSGIVSGTGSVFKTGSGTITIGTSGSGGASYTGGTTVDNGSLVLGGVASMTSTANIDLTGNNAGSLTVQNNTSIATTGAIRLGDTSSGAPFATTVLVQNNATLAAGSLTFGNATGRVQANTSVTVQNNASLAVYGTFNLNNVIGTAANNNTLNLNGGTATVGNFLAPSGAGTRTEFINFNGGMLQAATNDPSGSTFLPALGNLTVNVTNTTVPAYICSSNFIVTIAANLVNATANTDDGVVKSGSGTLTLGGNDTYKGLTTVSNGTLYITDVQQTPIAGLITVNNNKAFGVINSPGYGQSAQITSLTMGNSTGPSTLLFSNVSDTYYPVLNLNNSGVLTLNGNCTLKIADDVNLTAGNEYPLINYAGGSIVTNSGAGFVLSPPAGLTGYVTNDPSISAIALVVTGITVIVPPPAFSGVTASGSDLILSATNGVPGNAVTVLSTTDLTLPLASWTTVTTGNFDGSGNFTYTVSGAISSGLPQQFYYLNMAP